MSMRENPCSGYVVPVAELRPFLLPIEQLKFDELVEENDFDELNNYLATCRANNPERWGKIPSPIGCYALSDEDTPGDDELDKHVMYAMFDEGDLYVKKPTDSLVAMKEKGISPEFHAWSIWG